MKHTKIQWCDSTVNPVMGCDGCELRSKKQGVNICYAGVTTDWRGEKPGWPKDFDKPETFPGRMTKAAGWSALNGCDRPDKAWLNGMPRMIFVSDMGDALSKAIPFNYLKAEIVDIALTPRGRRHIWQWLTKQPGRMAEFSTWIRERGVLWPENLWVGTSLTSASSTNRIKALLRVGTERTVRFVSVEPQWEDIDTEWLPKVDWIIQGGQSGTETRPFDLAWARSMRDGARRAGVPYFLKQLGAHAVENGRRFQLQDHHGGDWNEWPKDLRVREVPRPHAVTDARSSGLDHDVPPPDGPPNGGTSPGTRRRHLRVVQAAEDPAPPSKESRKDQQSPSVSELFLFRRGERLEDPERRWEAWQTWFLRWGSVLFRWLALASVHDVFWGRDPKVVEGYVPRRARGRKIASLAIFFHALRNDTGITQRTAYREIGYAHDLLKKFGKPWVLRLLGTRVANDDGFLRSLIRLRNKEQAKQVTDIYTQGAGETKAKERVSVYLDIQAQAEEEKLKKGKLLPPAPEKQEEPLAKRLLALGLRLKDVLDVVTAELELAKEEKAIKTELSDLRTELQALEPAGTKKRRQRAPRVPGAIGLDLPVPQLDPLPDGATNIVQFVADQAELTGALRTVALVKPMGVTEQGGAGYLFGVGGETCRVHGRTADTAVSAAVRIRDVIGEGMFAFPVDYVPAVTLRRGQPTGMISLRAYSLGDKRLIQYATPGGIISPQRTTFDPARLTPMDKALAESTNPRRYKSATLSQALTMAQPFVVGARPPKDDRDKRQNENAPPAHKFASIHEGERDGTLFATNGHERFAFYCDDFRGKVAQFPSESFHLLISFLRWCGPEVELRDGKEMTFAVSGDGQRAVGWTTRSSPTIECKLLPSSWYRVVLRVPREAALEQLRCLRAEIEEQSQRKGWDTIRIRYASETRHLHLAVVKGGAATSEPIAVEVVEGSENLSYEYNISATYLIDLLDGVHTVHAELGMLSMAEHGVPQGGAVFRTLDEFLLDSTGRVVGGAGAEVLPESGAFKCKVARLAPASPP